MSLLQQLTKITDRPKKRIGRGYGSGKGGHTSSRGQKGQSSRTGYKTPLWFEGGQLPFVRRFPFQRGKGRFRSLTQTAEITFNDINRFDFDVVSLDSLKANKILPAGIKKVKIVKKGELKKIITVKGLPVTKGAAAMITKKGGKIEA